MRISRGSNDVGEMALLSDAPRMAKVRAAVRSVVGHHVGARNANPAAIDQQPHDGLAIHHGLDEVGSRPAVLDVAARLPIAILVGTVIHTPVVHMCRRGRCAQKHAEQHRFKRRDKGAAG